MTYNHRAMSHELTIVEGAEGDRLVYRSRHMGQILGRLFGLFFLAPPAILFYMLIFHRDPQFGRGTADMPGWLQIVIVSPFLLIPFIFCWFGLDSLLSIRGIEIDRTEGTIREYSGWIVPWRREVHRISDFKGVAIREERGVKFSTIHALYLVGNGRKDLRIDAWDRWETETEASRLAQFLNLKMAEL